MSFTCLPWCHVLANMSSLVTLYCIFSLFLLSLFCSQTKRKIKSCILLPRNNLKLVGFPFTTWRGWNLEVGSILTRWVESLRPNKPVGWFDPKSYVQPTKKEGGVGGYYMGKTIMSKKIGASPEMSSSPACEWRKGCLD